MTHSSPVNTEPQGYTEAEGYAASLRQMAQWVIEGKADEVDEGELCAAANFIERAGVHAQQTSDLPALPDDDADFTPDLARKIISKYQEILGRAQSTPVAWRWKVSPNQKNWCWGTNPPPAQSFNLEPLYAFSSPHRGAVDPTRPACGQADEWGRKPTDEGYGQAAIQPQSTRAPVAWRYRCEHDGKSVFMERRLTDEQKARGYFLDDIELEENPDTEEGPFKWTDETPVYAHTRPTCGGE